jgi:peptidoglycan/LPS O-acetylase OafA/YrhL
MSMQFVGSAEALLPAQVTTGATARATPYRPDIDGLRAICVLAVILFHAKVPGFAGGYVGVDVFFVISGYLITQLLVAPSERSAVRRLGDFYVRRCRRILPALIVTLLAAAALAYWLFLPIYLTHFGTQLSATSLFVGNVTLWHAGGYFDLQTPFDPLTHLWSIAVEEQFYIVFPLLFLASARAPRGGRKALVASAALISFAIGVWASYQTANAGFYLAPARAWELLLGSLVALGVGSSLSTHPARETLAGAALLALAICIIEYDSSLRYPGVYAVVPCASGALLLATASRSPSRTARWLSVRPLVFSGLISYSLYLWHLPVFAFAGYYNIRPLDPLQIAVLLAAIYSLSALSWRYIETPIRGRTWLKSDVRFLYAVGAATLAIGLLGVIFSRTEGLPGRLDEADARLVGTLDRIRVDARACANQSLNEIAAGSLCRLGPSTGTSAVVWGDSHALALLPAYAQIATARGVPVYVGVAPRCRPLLDASSETEPPVRRRECGAFNRAMVSAIKKLDPALVILNAYWTYPDLAIAISGGGEAGSGRPPFEQAFERTLRAISTERRKVCVIGDVPTLDYQMPYAAYMARKRGLDPAFFTLRLAEAKLQHPELDRWLAELRQGHGFSFVDLKAALCAGPTCALVTHDGRSVYRDENHLSSAGAYMLASSLEGCFDTIGEELTAHRAPPGAPPLP